MDVLASLMKKWIIHSKLFAFGSHLTDRTAKFLNNYTLLGGLSVWEATLQNFLEQRFLHKHGTNE